MTSSNAAQQLADFIALLNLEPGVLVRVESTEGSAPREAGSWMAVFENALVGTIGGGHLEHEAIARARALTGVGKHDATRSSFSFSSFTASQADPDLLRFALGPSLGQCCGGVVHLRLRAVTAKDAVYLAAQLRPAFEPVALFGGGHVGHALVQVLSNLPFGLTWIDSRDDVFPGQLPPGVVCEHSSPVHAAVSGLASGSAVLIMSFSHAEDLDVVAACLQRQRDRADLPFIGLIGSQTKWATFRKRLEARGFTPAELAQVTCPIGVAGIQGKEPGVIAVSVAAQLLQSFSKA